MWTEDGCDTAIRLAGIHGNVYQPVRYVLAHEFIEQEEPVNLQPMAITTCADLKQFVENMNESYRKGK